MKSTPSSTGPNVPSAQVSSAPETPSVDMLIRIWMRDQRSSEAERGPSPPGLLELIEDVAGCRNGRIQASDGVIHVCGLGSAAEALVLSRQLQLAVNGFRSRSGALPVSVSVGIDVAAANAPSPDTAPTKPDVEAVPLQPSHDLVSLLRISRPAQVLLTNDASRQMASVTWLPLKSFPGRFGVFEYLWTDPGKLDRLQSDPQLAQEVMSSAAASQSAPAADAVPSTAAPHRPLGRRTLGSGDEENGSGNFLRRLISLPVLASTVVAAIVLGVAGLMLTHSNHAAPPAQPTRHSAIEAARVPAPAPSRPATPVQRVPVEKVTEPATPFPSATAAPTTKQKPLPRNVPTASPQPPPGDCADLGTIYQIAENYRQHGELEDAERRFEHILRCDKGNADARRGLAKTRAAMGEQEHHNDQPQ